MRAFQAPIITSSHPDPLERLSAVQRVAVQTTLEVWKQEYEAGHTRIDLSRVSPEAIPTWARWSNCPWVSRDILGYRKSLFDRPEEIPICFMMHLALPPGWHRKISVEAEQVTIRRYGYWTTETTWVPPLILSSRGLWIRKPS